MLLHLTNVLSSDELAAIRVQLATAGWADGRITAGHQSAQVKFNQQMPQTDPVSLAVSAQVQAALQRSTAFQAAILPARIFPPLINRYGEGMGFGDHIDNGLRVIPEGLPGAGSVVRTDVSGTLFLSDPADYDGGELVIEDTFGSHRVKLAAGDLVLYPGTSIHRVEPVTRGVRLAAFFWAQSQVREDAQRALLHDLDLAIGGLTNRGLGAQPELVMLTGLYHNLLRRWAQPC